MVIVYYVELFEVIGGSELKKIATFNCEEESNGSVSVEVECQHPAVESIMSEGIYDHKEAKPGKLYPTDGMRFLENLKYNFKTDGLMATDVQKKVVG